MFVEAHAVAGAPLAVAAGRIAEYLTAHRLDFAAAAAVAESEPVLVRAGVAGLTKRVAVQALEPVHGPDRVVIAIRWLATGKADQLFPALDANLELRAAGDAHTELILLGAYQPPFGRVGAAIDQLVLHRLAEATLRRFTTDVAEMVNRADALEPAPDAEPQLDSQLEAGA